MHNTVSIATKPLVYSAFRYLSHKAWNALAEYVDNSLQSFIDHKEILKSINPNGKLTVKIDIDVAEDRIEIIDNAFGIEESNFERAFELANIPLDASGLNEFGMGMKVSSIWFSDWWTLETSAYGDPYKKKVIFDLNDVASNEKLSLDVNVTPAKAEDHYTKITLRQLAQNNKPAGRTLGAIKKHLTSIYIKFIREGILDLYVNGELMLPSEPQILKAAYYKTPSSSPIEWKYEVDFEAPKLVFGKHVGSYKAKGFIGVLETMSEVDSGILLFRRGRVIGSSYDDKYKPKLLSGSPGSPRYKRIFGELELDGFNVSFNKSSFVEDEDFYEFIEMLKDDISSSKTLDIFGQAENYRKPVSPNAKKKIASKFSHALNRTSVISINESALATPTSSPSPINIYNQIASETNPQTLFSDSSGSSDTTPSNVSNTTAGFEDEKIELNLFGKTYTLIIGTKFSSKNGLYSLQELDRLTYRTDLNLDNPFFERFNKTFSSEEGVDSVMSFISSMIATEIELSQKNDIRTGKIFREGFNKYFGNL